ncbi:O-antigen ligase family protein [Marinobacter salinisoli]|uniref:O-antigen ligase family protein n=1 Tax=Marinobacter salinisoli TaxID=2769486 RepID=A0ABX7MUJ3_9GAMM|nr:O-antigen ligase family protein [Marinobacter salinisoli]QSP96057.1 O-antigen ligase family protein [Marinobacter salinisoli]
MTTKFESIVQGRKFSSLMFFCVLGFVFFKRFHRDVGDVFIFLAVLGTFASIYFSSRPIKKDPIVVAFFVSLIIPVVSWLNSRLQIPDLAKDSPSPFFFYDFFFFWFIAYWIQGRNDRISAVLLAYCSSVLSIYVSHSPDFMGDITRGIQGARISFDLVNAQHTSLFAGFGFIAAAFLFVAKLKLSRPLNLARKVLAALAALFFILIIVITQSRQVWLALFVCLFLAPLALKLLPNSRISVRGLVAGYLAFAVLLGSLSNLAIVEKRLAAELETIEQVAELDLDSISKFSSVGIRIHLWLEGLDWIAQRPILGSGEDARELVIAEGERFPEYVQKNFTHLHSSHVETFVSFGVVGGILVYFLMFYPVIHAVREPAVQKTWKVFSMVVLAFWITVNFFESYFYAANGVYIYSVFFGIIYSFRFSKVQGSASEDAAK